MSGRTRRTMIATAFNVETEYQTAGKYTVAGVVHYYLPGRKLVHEIIAVGTSPESVLRRTEALLRREHPALPRADYDLCVQVVLLTEATAPVVRDYFGTHKVVIDCLYKEGQPTDDQMVPGWAYPWDLGMTPRTRPMAAGRTVIRLLAREGFTALAFRKDGHIERFQVEDLLRSMNKRTAKRDK